MGNTLNEKLEGRVVIIGAEHLVSRLNTPDLRAFRVSGGFGASPVTSGSAIFGEFLFDGEKCRMEGWMVERFATEDEIDGAEAIREGTS